MRWEGQSVCVQRELKMSVLNWTLVQEEGRESVWEGFGRSKNSSLLLCSLDQLPVRDTTVTDHSDSCWCSQRHNSMSKSKKDILLTYTASSRCEFYSTGRLMYNVYVFFVWLIKERAKQRERERDAYLHSLTVSLPVTLTAWIVASIGRQISTHNLTVNINLLDLLVELAEREQSHMYSTQTSSGTHCSWSKAHRDIKKKCVRVDINNI